MNKKDAEVIKAIRVAAANVLGDAADLDYIKKLVEEEIVSAATKKSTKKPKEVLSKAPAAIELADLGFKRATSIRGFDFRNITADLRLQLQDTGIITFDEPQINRITPLYDKETEICVWTIHCILADTPGWHALSALVFIHVPTLKELGIKEIPDIFDSDLISFVSMVDKETHFPKRLPLLNSRLKAPYHVGKLNVDYLTHYIEVDSIAAAIDHHMDRVDVALKARWETHRDKIYNLKTELDAIELARSKVYDYKLQVEARNK